MKILLILAIAMAGGLALSRLMKLLNLPNVTGYLIAGILIGPFVLKLVTNVDIKSAKIITTTMHGFHCFSHRRQNLSCPCLKSSAARLSLSQLCRLL